MPHPFPLLNEQKQPHAWAIAPNAGALNLLAEGIWNCAVQTNQRPLVVLSTAGPLMGVRAALEKYRPKDLPSHIAFLPQVMSFNDWLEAAPGAWKFPKKQSDLERWLSVYATLRKHKQLQAWFKAETEAGSWGLAQAIIAACDTLSNSIAPSLQQELRKLITNQEEPITQNTESWIETLEPFLDRTIGQAYPALARKVVDQEAQVLLTFWRYITSPSDPAFRKQFAMAAHLEAAKKIAQANVRPLIWVETADPTPIDKQLIQGYLTDYAQFAPAVEVTMNWESVALWAEALGPQMPEAQKLQAIQTNLHNAHSADWHLIAAKRFEELAWATAKTIEQQLIDGKTNIALVAQDRLVARRARALLARLGPSLKIQDETGWKLSTTRAAAALNSWLELLRAPPEGPSAADLLEFLQNPFLDLGKCLNANSTRDAESLNGLVAQLEDILIASQAKSGWETFHMAIEGSVSHGSVAPNPLLLELLQSIRGRLNRWRGVKINCALAHQYLIDDLIQIGMTQGLEKDSAGKQLLELLETFDFDVEHQQIAMRLNEWLSLLKTVIEESSYEEMGVSAAATLSILPLSSTRFREFEAIVMVGCDEQQLPAFSEPPLFFSDALNRLLGGSSIEAQFVQQARDLSQLLTSFSSVDLLWQSKSKSGEPLRASAWIQRLQMDLPNWQAQNASALFAPRSGAAIPSQMAIAKIDSDLPMPVSMSPSAYKALRDCPYKYYVRSLLGLRKLKGFEEGFDASLAGQTLHKILRNFYHAMKSEAQKSSSPMTADLELRRAWMQDQLTLISEQVFKRLIEGDARVLGVLRDWQKQIPSFIHWQLEREAQGWQFHDAEVKVGFDLPFTDVDGNERHIRIEGYADRFDVSIHDSKAASVIDYKNQNLTKVEWRSEAVLDDPQLLIYARASNESKKISGREVNAAEWVALKADVKKEGDEAARTVAIEAMPELMQEFSEQMTEDVQSLWSGKPLKAFAPDSVCQYCEARGICRKGMW
ncbi:PD-(D/E)XK nuclease family protein [Polynucleobacter sp. AP-Ainpum-60-G11]|uniref:PD-(D/E)XK nuclease family protein n=1 Tax=Polynucleobacter sp. AP-Ainpum-60-G11 TaxID=2576926 RepID=UPI001BFE9509|nr:PD-(D/E)XK nuclease family protein [Polynucleobacter sp. AP-Ainpum-60-G11]QWE26018.1 PD-(D/E)XK nuclease family protein [Polynucleobacter sp. AP-Ainpum-60-G11]